MADGMKTVKVTKVLVVGDPGVGKTSIIRRFIDREFVANRWDSTLGVDFCLRCTTIDGITHKMQVWDTCGGERWTFRAVGRSFYRNTAAAILVFDITNRKSYDCLLKNWLTGFRVNTANADRKAIPFIVGHKSDLHDQRQVFREEAEAFARSIGALYYEASARTGDNVDQMFEEIGRRALIEDGKAQALAAQSTSQTATRANNDQGKEGTSCIMS